MARSEPRALLLPKRCSQQLCLSASLHASSPAAPPFSSSPNPPASCRGAQGDPAAGARQGGASTRGAPSAHQRPGDGRRAAARARSSWRQHLAGGAGAGRVAWLPAGVWFGLAWCGVAPAGARPAAGRDNERDAVALGAEQHEHEAGKDFATKPREG